MRPRVRIDRLDLDLRGIDPVLAEAALRLLGPALEARLSGAAVHQPAAKGTAADGPALAHHLADRIAGQLPPGHGGPGAGRQQQG